MLPLDYCTAADYMGWKWAELLSRWTQIHYEHGGVIHQTPQAPERSFQNEDVLANLSYFFLFNKKITMRSFYAIFWVQYKELFYREFDFS